MIKIILQIPFEGQYYNNPFFLIYLFLICSVKSYYQIDHMSKLYSRPQQQQHNYGQTIYSNPLFDSILKPLLIHMEIEFLYMLYYSCKLVYSSVSITYVSFASSKSEVVRLRYAIEAFLLLYNKLTECFLSHLTPPLL